MTGKLATLTIYNTKSRDSGTYMITASNDVGCVTAHTKVTVIDHSQNIYNFTDGKDDR